MDYVTKDTALTATADAIREKAGTADPITWLEELGFSEAIAGIESGADLDELFGAKVATGSVIPSSNTTELTIVDFGGIFSATPYFFVVFENTDFSGGTINRFYGQMTGHQKSNDVKGTCTSFTNRLCIDEDKKLGSTTYGWGDYVLTKDAGYIAFSSNYCRGLAGNEYFWIAVGE